MYVSVYNPETTFPDFADLDLRTTGLDRVGLFRRHHRLALPLLASATSRTEIDADVVLASSTGWAHGVRATGRKVVYCHAPARWLYQSDRYVGSHSGGGIGGRAYSAAVSGSTRIFSAPLLRWDARSAQSADRYLANSSVTREAIWNAYGIEAEVLPPPPALLPDGPERAVEAMEPGFLLCVARLLPYKNVDAVIEAVRRIPGARLVVVGDGPDRARLARLAAGEPRITLIGSIPDDVLRWLYRNCSALVAASYEDYGLSPLEAASFGRPTVAFRAGGYLDTVREGVTGVFFEAPEPEPIAAAIEAAGSVCWQTRSLLDQAQRLGIDRFVGRLRTIVAEEMALV